MKRSREEAIETQTRLVEVGRRHFTEQGYADASLEQIAQEAGVTRGALYHHFSSKKGLFEAVLESVQRQLGERVAAEAEQSAGAWEQLLVGCRAFVSAAVDPAVRRILLIDGPAVLGSEAWRRMDEENSMRHLREQLELLQRQGELKPLPLDAMTHFLSGALNESALWIAQKPDDAVSLEETMTVITYFLEGIHSR